MSGTLLQIGFSRLSWILMDELCLCRLLGICQKPSESSGRLPQHPNIVIFTNIGFKSEIMVTGSRTWLLTAVLPILCIPAACPSPDFFCSLIVEKHDQIWTPPSLKHFHWVKSPSAASVVPQFPFGGALFLCGKAERTRLFHLFRSYLRMVNGQNNVCSCFRSTMADVLPWCYKSFPFSRCRKSVMLAAWIVKVSLAGHPSKNEWHILHSIYVFNYKEISRFIGRWSLFQFTVAVINKVCEAGRNEPFVKPVNVFTLWWPVQSHPDEAAVKPVTAVLIYSTYCCHCWFLSDIDTTFFFLWHRCA